MTLDPSVIAAAAVTVIAATVSGVVTVINALAASKDRAAARASRAEIVSSVNANTQRADTLIGKTAEIHANTNGNLTKAQAALDVALAQIEGYKTLIASLVQANEAHTAAATAAAAATSAAAVAVAKVSERRVRASDTTKGEGEGHE